MIRKNNGLGAEISLARGNCPQRGKEELAWRRVFSPIQVLAQKSPKLEKKPCKKALNGEKILKEENASLAMIWRGEVACRRGGRSDL